MTENHDHEAHELRDLLRSADPAASLAPADPTRVARLLEITMTDTLTDESRTDESRTDGTHHRSRLTWLVAAAATVLIGGGALFAVTQGSSDPARDVADDPAPSSPAVVLQQTVTELTAPGAGAIAAKCMSPLENPQIVAMQTTAFDGTVTSISGDKVTLEPSKFYAGDETDLVVVEAPSADMAALLSAVTFEEGGRYLISATDGQVTLCGFSAPYDPALAGVYAEAFPG